jgi:hypothetical protein
VIPDFLKEKILNLGQHCCNHSSPTSGIVVGRYKQTIVSLYHIRATLRIQSIHVNPTAALDVNRICLAIRSAVAGCSIAVVEIGREAACVQE